ncbi:MAG: hypothetical protein BWY10_02430 [Chloroflexi bacterium ADurb.Bin180]|nr:MAG: hypothetical protein BWY10_02430 [Chloroflexi bacterium ADurb.Bin180]
MSDVKPDAEQLAQFARAYVLTRASADLADDAPVRFVASTEGVKRDGLDLRVEDWSLDNFLRHPVILWAHDYENRLPLGTGTPSFEGSNLMIDVEFDRDDEFAQQVRRKALKGMVAGSVGWNDLKDGKRDLMEFSIVPVPADPLALPQRARAAMQSLAREIDRAFGAESGAVETSSQASADGQRKGAVMSARDMEKLEQAIAVLQELLARAKHEDKKPDDKPEAKAEDAERDSPVLAQLLEKLTRIGG